MPSLSVYFGLTQSSFVLETNTTTSNSNKKKNKNVRKPTQMVLFSSSTCKFRAKGLSIGSVSPWKYDLIKSSLKTLTGQQDSPTDIQRSKPLTFKQRCKKKRSRLAVGLKVLLEIENWKSKKKSWKKVQVRKIKCQFHVGITKFSKYSGEINYV